jgi:phage anti-repressor protein
MNNTIKELPPRRKDEIVINARLLYLYVGCPEICYDKWEASLPQIVKIKLGDLQFRIMTGDDGELALNPHLACYFACMVAADLMGVIALILIKEGVEAANQGDFNYTNHMLHLFKSLAMYRGQMLAELLHAFLQVGEPYDLWIIRLKEKHSMRYGSDYVRVSYGTKKTPKIHKTDIQKGDVILGPRFAAKIAAAEHTRRGRLVQYFLRQPKPGSGYSY